MDDFMKDEKKVSFQRELFPFSHLPLNSMHFELVRVYSHLMLVNREIL
jgi:hypothetical protein